MKSDDYTIEFSKLVQGLNSLCFAVDDKFLSDFEFSPTKTADTQANLELLKSDNMLDLKFNLDGTAHCTCDICLDEFEVPIEDSFSLLIKFTEDNNNLDDQEIIYLNRKEHQYNISQFLYESFLLSIPSKKSCELANKEHNIEVMKKLEKTNEEIQNQSNDPRWDKLKDLYTNN